jgi:hypothetical protein
MPPQPEPVACLPLLLSARMRAWWLLWQARRHPFRATAVVLVAVGLVVLAAHTPARGCTLRMVAVPGQRAHWVCDHA